MEFSLAHLGGLLQLTELGLQPLDLGLKMFNPLLLSLTAPALGLCVLFSPLLDACIHGHFELSLVGGLSVAQQRHNGYEHCVRELREEGGGLGLLSLGWEHFLLGLCRTPKPEGLIDWSLLRRRLRF